MLPSANQQPPNNAVQLRRVKAVLLAGTLSFVFVGGVVYATQPKTDVSAAVVPSSDSSHAATLVPQAVQDTQGPHEKYTHQDVIAALVQSDEVIPELPPVHPLHTIYNREGTVPPMCYTMTEGTHNPCYVCHQAAIPGRPNAMDDGDLQREYSFSDLGTTNHWKNLFEDRAQRIAEISDEQILKYVMEDNYSELAPRLRKAEFKGYIPDLKDLHLGAEAFDDDGVAKDGSHWVAFNYKPLPSTFWPTNGATDDVMIRLPERFRADEHGAYSRDVYLANLALVESSIKDLKSISVPLIDEKAIGTDLNGDGKLGKITRISKTENYVGGASKVIRRRFLFPQDTEFLHSVRYLGITEDDDIFNPPRMKELRYMRKRWAVTEPQLLEAYEQEHIAKDNGILPGFVDRGQHGLDNEMGWVIAGFIENKNGRLRVNTFEENFFCMGCHSSIGSTIDSTFSFARKIDGAEGWGYINLRGMPDAPNVGETKGEIATYLERAGGGGEFRSNPEMEARWFFADGAVNQEKVAAAKDVYELIAPSRERALQLNKAYRSIVQDQDFVFGRDPSVSRPKNVYDQVDNKRAPTLPENRTFVWDIRLDWSRKR